jgi:AraC-like DNA-binding protein
MSATIRDLSTHGVHCLDDPAITARQHKAGEVIALSLGAPAAMDVELATARAHPNHTAVAFLTTTALTRPAPGRQRMETEARSALVVTARGSMRVRFRERWRLTLALVPHEALEARASPVPSSPITLERRPLDHAMQRYIEVLLDSDLESSETERQAVGQLVIEMSAAVLLDRAADADSQMPNDSIYERAMAIIAQQCADPALSPEKVARAVPCSLRLLQARFAEEQNSIADEIRRQRARRAHAMLTDARFDALSVEEISHRAGFRVPMSMRRAFDREYGASPRALRRRLIDSAGRAPSGALTPLSPD